MNEICKCGHNKENHFDGSLNCVVQNDGVWVDDCMEYVQDNLRYLENKYQECITNKPKN